MATIGQKTKPELRLFDQNRMQFTDDQLRPYDGKWVAFSLDGRRIVAATADLEQLPHLVNAAGEQISNVELEYIDLSDDIFIGGAETI